MFYGIKKKIIMKNLEKRQSAGYTIDESELYELSPEDAGHVNNSYFFSAHTMDGESVFVRLGLRGDGNTEVWVSYSNNDLFVENEKELYLKGEEIPLTVKCVEPGKVWSFKYKGTMRDVKEENRRVFSGEMECTFTATEKIFDFFFDNDPTTTANGLAKEKWSKQLFAEIGENNQRHYEQIGNLKGVFKLNEDTYNLDMVAGRDHSFGPRRWSYMNKHLWVLGLDEGGKALNISMVSYPALNGLWTGYTTLFGKVDSIADIECKSDMNKAGHTDGHMCFTITLTNGKVFDAEIYRDRGAEYKFENGKYVFNEGLGHMVVDGKPLRGTVEFGFNEDKTRWEDK